MDPIDISKLERAWVLMRLYNAARPVGNARMVDRLVTARRGEMMTLEEAREIIAEREAEKLSEWHRYDFDYVYGRPLKVNLRGPALETVLYDRDQGGSGAAARALGLESG